MESPSIEVKFNIKKYMNLHKMQIYKHHLKIYLKNFLNYLYLKSNKQVIKYVSYLK